MREHFARESLVLAVDDKAVGECTADIAPDLDRLTHGFPEFDCTTDQTSSRSRLTYFSDSPSVIQLQGFIKL